MTSQMMPMCMACVHFNKEDNVGPLKCKAFPDGIPDEISTSKADHRKAINGDSGIRFKQDPKEDDYPYFLEFFGK